MEQFSSDINTTEIHSDEIDSIFNQDKDILNPDYIENDSFSIKPYLRLIRKKITHFINERNQKNFSNIIYLTLDCPGYTQNSTRLDSPVEYIIQMRKQYPENDIRIIIPLINIPKKTKIEKNITLNFNDCSMTLERTSVNFDFFHQNILQNAILYKFPQNDSHVQVYGLYSPSYSYCYNLQEMSKLQNLSAFLKAGRKCIKLLKTNKKENFKPDIVHCENIPFFLGAEFESNFSYPVKVLQIVKDFTQIEMARTELFWAIINLADERTMQKLCKDEVIKRCLAKLFNLHNTRRFYQIKECLDFIYKNYYKFRKYVDKGEDIDENILFNCLNSRVLKLFPQLTNNNEIFYNTMLFTIKKANYWATYSETYYKTIYENQELSGQIYPELTKTKDYSTYISTGIDTEKYPSDNTRQLYQGFNQDNFRELRKKNKTALIKEFSSDRIQTNFIDTTLFKDDNNNVIGYLDSFYEAPLIFSTLQTDLYANGVDVLFNTVLKLFELHKNVQFIINIPNGLSVDYIKSWVNFLSQNKYFNGRWVYIDNTVNLPKFLAGSDMILLPKRMNIPVYENLLAMHYGCVPVVSRNGMLNDTIIDIFDNITQGCGFKTKKSLITDENNTEIFLTPVIKAINLYQNNPSSWNLLIKNCLNKDIRWNFNILEKYNQIYQELI